MFVYHLMSLLSILSKNKRNLKLFRLGKCFKSIRQVAVPYAFVDRLFAEECAKFVKKIRLFLMFYILTWQIFQMHSQHCTFLTDLKATRNISYQYICLCQQE